jgi:hypothetical protein
MDSTHPLLSLIDCPIERTADVSGAGQIEEHTLDWFSRFGFGRSGKERELMLACAPGHCACLICPGASAEMLMFSSAYILWGLTFDTLLDQGDVTQRKQNYAVLAPALLQTLNNPWHAPQGLPPIILMLRDLRLYLEGRVSGPQIRRWVDSHGFYLTGVARELYDAEQGTLPSLNDFLYLRMYTAAGSPGGPLVELCSGPGPDQEALETPAIHALADAATTVMALLGDLGSTGKEGPLEYNVINVIRQELNCSRAEAVSEALRLCNRVIELFCQLRAQVAPSADAATGAYITGLASLVRGVLDWAATVPRYARHPASGIPDLAGAPRINPLTLPSVSWWWDQLKA